MKNIFFVLSIFCLLTGCVSSNENYKKNVKGKFLNIIDGNLTVHEGDSKRRVQINDSMIFAKESVWLNLQGNSFLLISQRRLLSHEKTNRCNGKMESLVQVNELGQVIKRLDALTGRRLTDLRYNHDYKYILFKDNKIECNDSMSYFSQVKLKFGIINPGLTDDNTDLEEVTFPDHVSISYSMNPWNPNMINVLLNIKVEKDSFYQGKRIKSGLYSLSLIDKSLTFICNFGKQHVWGANSENIYFVEGGDLYMYSVKEGVSEKILSSSFKNDFDRLRLSPDGKSIYIFGTGFFDIGIFMSPTYKVLDLKSGEVSDVVFNPLLINADWIQNI